MPPVEAMAEGRAFAKGKARAVAKRNAQVKAKAKSKARPDKLRRQMSRRAAIKMLNDLAVELDLGVEPHAAERDESVGDHEASSLA